MASWRGADVPRRRFLKAGAAAVGAAVTWSRARRTLAHPRTQAGPIRFGPNVAAIPFPPNVEPFVDAPHGEPHLLVAPDGKIFVSSHFQPYDSRTGQPSQTGASANVWVSTDGGRSFRISGGLVGQAGNDVHLVRTPSGVVLMVTMTNVGLGTGVGGASVTRSTDGGRTWQTLTAVNKTILCDRPFLLVNRDDDVLLTYTGPPGDMWAVRSADQGATWGLPERLTVLPPQLGICLSAGPAVNRARGELVVPFASSSSPDWAARRNEDGYFNRIGIARSGGETPLSGWREEAVIETPLGQGAATLFAVACDDRGREAIAYSARDAAGNQGVWLLRSDRPGQWSSPRRIDPAGTTGHLPFVVARGDGGLAVAYLSSAFADARETARPWTVKVAVSRDFGATFTHVPVSDHVVYAGSLLEGRRVFWDLIGLALDREGYMHVAWGDQGDVQPNNYRTSIVYARQVSGPPLGG